MITNVYFLNISTLFRITICDTVGLYYYLITYTKQYCERKFLDPMKDILKNCPVYFYPSSFDTLFFNDCNRNGSDIKGLHVKVTKSALVCIRL